MPYNILKFMVDGVIIFTYQDFIFKYNVHWTYKLSPKLSDYLNSYKAQRRNEYLSPPALLQRGNITITDILKSSNNEQNCKAFIQKWAREVYDQWSDHHHVIDKIAEVF